MGHGSRADQFLEQSLSYLRSPQEPLQEAAVRFIGEPQALALLCPTAAWPQRLLLLAESRARGAVQAQGGAGALAGLPAAVRQLCPHSGCRWEPC